MNIEPDPRLWPAIIAKVSEISMAEGRGTHGMNRSEAFYSSGGSVMVVAEAHRPDGMVAVYVVTASVGWGNEVNCYAKPTLSDSPHFWDPKVAELALGAGDVAIIEHRWYQIGAEKTHGSSRGFGGQRFDIEFTDGRKVTSTNVWTCGVIPPTYWDRLPDNAVMAGAE